MTWDKVVNALMTQVTTLFIGLTSLSTSIFLFVEHPFDGDSIRRSLRDFPEVPEDANERKSMVPCAIAALILYTVGVIAISLWACWNAPVMAHQSSFRVRYYWLIAGFRPNRWWWRSVLLLKGLVLNLTLVVFDSPKSQIVFLTLLLTSSLAVLFMMRPWPTLVQNVADTSCHFCLSLVLSSTALRIKTVGNSTDVDKNVAFTSMVAPLFITVACTFIPLFQFFTRQSYEIRRFRQGQHLRDLLMLVTRRTSNEMNVFLRSLNDDERRNIGLTMATFQSKMFFLHPPNNNRIIPEVKDYRAGSACRTTRLLEQAIVEENRTEVKSLQERACLQWFIEKLFDGYYPESSSTGASSSPSLHADRSTVISHCSKRSRGMKSMKLNDDQKNEPITLKEVFQNLDVKGQGSISMDDFIESATKANPKISNADAEQVFKMLDLDDNGSLTYDEFYILMSGMTFTGQAMDMHTRDGRLLRRGESMQKLEEHRRATYRLAMLFENDGNAGTKIESTPRSRELNKLGARPSKVVSNLGREAAAVVIVKHMERLWHSSQKKRDLEAGPIATTTTTMHVSL